MADDDDIFQFHESLTLPDPLERRLFDEINISSKRGLSGLLDLKADYPLMSPALKRKFRIACVLLCTTVPDPLFPRNAQGFRDPRLMMATYGLPGLQPGDEKPFEKIRTAIGQILALDESIPQRKHDIFKGDPANFYQQFEDFNFLVKADCFRLLEEINRITPKPVVHTLIRDHLLSRGRFEQAWKIYTGPSLCCETLQYRAKCWSGEDLQGKRVLLWLRKSDTAGFGDCMNFIWTAREFKKLGASRVLIALSQSMRTLIEYSLPDVEIWDDEQPFDYIVPCWLDLLRGLQYTPRRFEVPRRYLKAPSVKLNLRELERSLGIHGKIRIGLCWYASDYKSLEKQKSSLIVPSRSLDFEKFKSFFELKDSVNFYSLQPDRKTIDDSVGYPIIHLSEHTKISSWADTASIANQLDLVITADTAAGHLAGALGVPVWILLFKVCDFRWGLTGSRSHWYPNARLFRQKVECDWQPVIEQVRAELKLFCQQR